MSGNKRGLTLIEVILAAAIMSMVLTGMLVCVSRCLAVIRVSRNYHKAITVFGLGEVKYPPRLDKGIEEVEVDEDSDIMEGFKFARTVDDLDDENEDGLYILRSRVSWMDRGHEAYHEVVQYVYMPDKK